MSKAKRGGGLRACLESVCRLLACVGVKGVSPRDLRGAKLEPLSEEVRKKLVAAIGQLCALYTADFPSDLQARADIVRLFSLQGALSLSFIKHTVQSAGGEFNPTTGSALDALLCLAFLIDAFQVVDAVHDHLAYLYLSVSTSQDELSGTPVWLPSKVHTSIPGAGELVSRTDAVVKTESGNVDLDAILQRQQSVFHKTQLGLQLKGRVAKEFSSLHSLVECERRLKRRTLTESRTLQREMRRAAVSAGQGDPNGGGQPNGPRGSIPFTSSDADLRVKVERVVVDMEEGVAAVLAWNKQEELWWRWLAPQTAPLPDEEDQEPIPLDETNSCDTSVPLDVSPFETKSYMDIFSGLDEAQKEAVEASHASSKPALPSGHLEEIEKRIQRLTDKLLEIQSQNDQDFDALVESLPCLKYYDIIM